MDHLCNKWQRDDHMAEINEDMGLAKGSRCYCYLGTPPPSTEHPTRMIPQYYLLNMTKISANTLISSLGIVFISYDTGPTCCTLKMQLHLKKQTCL